MPSDLFGCWNHRKLKALIPPGAVALKNLREWSAVGGEKDFVDSFILFLRSCGGKICLNKCHGNSENSDGCPYLLGICLIYGTSSKSIAESNPSAGWPRIRRFWCASRNTVLVQTDFIWKFRREWLLWTEYASCERNHDHKVMIASGGVLDVIYRIAVKGSFVGIVIKSTAASVHITDLLFAFAFC